MSDILLVEQATPATPGAGECLIYPKNDGFWYFVGSDGVEHRFVRGDGNETISGNKTFSGKIIGAGTPESDAKIGVRRNGNAYEWGHANTGSGHASTLGVDAAAGNPFIGFNCEAGSTSNTYRTRGIQGLILKHGYTGNLLLQSAENVSADNQAPVTYLTFGKGQITFPATQNASVDANTLDDYEEGIGIPSIGGTATYTAQLLNYRKIGSFVYLYMDIGINVIGTGSAAAVTGIPFAPAATISGVWSVNFFANLLTNVVFLAGFQGGASTTLGFQGLTAAANGTGAINVFQNAARIVCAGVLHV